MHRGNRLLSSLFLTAALAAPLATMAVAAPQDSRTQEKRDDHNRRYYDRAHKDYHTWDGNEDRAYVRYQNEHHETHAFAELNSRQQTVYWNWRHSHPDGR